MDERKDLSSGECRRREEASIRLEQKFEDFIKDYQRNEDEKHKRLVKLEERLKPLEELILQAKWPVRLAVWMIGLVTAGLLYQTGLHAINLVKRIAHY